MRTLLKIAVMGVAILLNTCNTTEPQYDVIAPGRRDYSWKVDTLAGLNSPRFRMWGSSPTDIWATTSSNWEVSISHFDGRVWSSFGVPGIVQPNAIYGFSSNNIFLGDENGKIWRYCGNNWILFAEIEKDEHTNIVFSNIWGENINSLYATGAYPEENGGYNMSVIAHLDNGNWEMLNTNKLYGIVTCLYKNFSDNKIYLQVIGGHNFTDSTKIYEYVNGDFQKLYGNIWTQGLQSDISLIKGEVYFILGNEIAKRKNNQFITFLQVNNPNFYQRIWGRNSKDIFLLMTDGLAHYNGNDIEYLFYFNVTPRTQIYGAALFENDAFFVVDEAQTGLSLVYHGILQ
ncbi:MAG: hypothetical protein HXY50_01970 [Ignavibacteriaceae bacterium]|nr:hypothetical protein [Ignavibacteriaceae bacterium]